MNDFKPDLQYFSTLTDYQFNDEHELKDTLLQGKYIYIPFHPSRIITSICNGIRFNYGLFTQCNNNISQNNNISLCNTCFRNTHKNNMIHPIATISQRINTHFKDIKNRSPIPFHKFCKKFNYNPIIFKNTMDYFNIQYFSHDFDSHNNNNHKNIIISDEHSFDKYTYRYDLNNHNNNNYNNNNNNNNNIQLLTETDTETETEQHEYDLITTLPFKYNNQLFLKDSHNFIYHFHNHSLIGKFYFDTNIIIFN